MNLRLAVPIACLLALLGQPLAHGQRETERYIPIGQSPGASGITTRIGTIDAVDGRARSFVLVTAEGRHTVTVTPQSRIWLDRYRQKQTALTGSFADLQAGRRAEVCYQDPARAKRIYWIKIEVRDDAAAPAGR
jgi:hypothetical protein